MHNIKKKVIISYSNKKHIKKAILKVSDDYFQWAYFGEDVLASISLEKHIGSKGTRLNIGSELQSTAKRYRQKYIDYIGHLSVEYDSLSWWASSFSEKNPFVSKTFLYICYGIIAERLIKSNSETLVLFVENKTLGLFFADNISYEIECDVTCVGSFKYDFLDNLMDTFEYLIRHSWFLLKHIYRVFLSKHVFKLDKKLISGSNKVIDDELILLHTWIDKRSFTKDDVFQDAYFGTLKDYIHNMHKKILIVPSILHTVSFLDSITKMVKNKDALIVPAAHLYVSDIVRVLKITMKKPEKNLIPSFLHLDISVLSYYDNLNDWKHTRLPSNLLNYYFIKNLKSSGFHVGRFIYTYENHTWEKVFCFALHEFYPHAAIIGYQHGGFPKMLINHFFPQKKEI